MGNPDTGTGMSARDRARVRIIAPVSGQLRRAGWLSVAAGGLWPVQAAALAWAVSGWVSGEPPMERAVIAALVFLVCATLKSALEHRAGALLFAAADQTIARERAVLIQREARAPGPEGSASVASLIVQKLPLLQPWVTRYHVAMVRATVLPLVLLVLAFSQSWVVGLTLLVAGPLIPVFMALVGMAAEDASKRQLDEIGTLNDMVMDRLAAMLDIRLLGAAERAALDCEKRADNLRERTMAVLRVAFLSSTVLELFSALGVAMVAVFVGFTLLGEIGFGSWGTGLTIGEGLFLLLIAPEFFQPLRELAAAWHDRAAGFAVVAELDALDAADRVTFVGAAVPSDPVDGPMNVAVSGAKIRLSERQVILPDFDLGKGESLALVGPSGVGKTTTLSAIAGLVPLSAGKIVVCRTLLAETTADAVRARVAWMPQRLHFPDQSLAEWMGTVGSDRDPWPALQMADAADIVRNLPKGLDTRLGQTGGGVSGGEARRLFLARTIHTGADLILADEPTSDLDRDTALRIIGTLKQLQDQGRTIIVATHDPELVSAMDHKVELGS